MFKTCSMKCRAGHPDITNCRLYITTVLHPQVFQEVRITWLTHSSCLSQVSHSKASKLLFIFVTLSWCELADSIKKNLKKKFSWEFVVVHKSNSVLVIHWDSGCLTWNGLHCGKAYSTTSLSHLHLFIYFFWDLITLAMLKGFRTASWLKASLPNSAYKSCLWHIS